MELKIILLVTELVILRERGPRDGWCSDLLIWSNFPHQRAFPRCDLERKQPFLWADDGE